jgi:lysozyme family protein
MRTMTRADALAIYRSQYFHAPKFDDVFAISPGIAAELFDTGVNMGPEKPSSSSSGRSTPSWTIA